MFTIATKVANQFGAEMTTNYSEIFQKDVLIIPVRGMHEMSAAREQAAACQMDILVVYLWYSDVQHDIEMYQLTGDLIFFPELGAIGFDRIVNGKFQKEITDGR